jgi:hypothetical protein
MELRIETLWHGKEGQLSDLEMRIETLWNGEESQLSGLEMKMIQTLTDMKL